jgi:hypothetical protein
VLVQPFLLGAANFKIIIMKTTEGKIKDVNEQILVFEKSLKGDGSNEAREWAEKYLTKLQKKRDKLIQVKN